MRRASNDVITGEVIAEELLSNAKYEKLEILNSYREGGKDFLVLPKTVKSYDGII